MAFDNRAIQLFENRIALDLLSGVLNTVVSSTSAVVDWPLTNATLERKIGALINPKISSPFYWVFGENDVELPHSSSLLVSIQFSRPWFSTNWVDVVPVLCFVSRHFFIFNCANPVFFFLCSCFLFRLPYLPGYKVPSRLCFHLPPIHDSSFIHSVILWKSHPFGRWMGLGFDLVLISVIQMFHPRSVQRGERFLFWALLAKPWNVNEMKSRHLGIRSLKADGLGPAASSIPSNFFSLVFILLDSW